LKYVFIMDPIETIKPHKDTSYHLICAAGELGHEVFFTGAEDLFVKHGELYSHVASIVMPKVPGKTNIRIGTSFQMSMAEADAVFIRTDPPFDRRYFYLTLLADFLPARTVVVNRPQTLRDWNEKLAALKFPEWTPRTLVARKASDILEFQGETGGTITLKPIDGHGGRGIFFLDPKERNRDAIISSITHDERHWIIAQAYVEDAPKGDKRILLLNGDPLGAILRVHAEGKELNNLDAGGTAQPCDLTERDLAICSALKPLCLEKGLLFAGIDIIGDMLIEINVTSPTGIQEMSRFHDRNFSLDVIRAVEEARHDMAR